MAYSELYQVSAPHFCAGIVTIAGRIVEAAPVLAWAKGMTLFEFERYCKRKGWVCEVAQ